MANNGIVAIYEPILNDGGRQRRILKRRDEVEFSNHGEQRWRERGCEHLDKHQSIIESVQVDADDLHRVGLLHGESARVFVIEDKTVATVLKQEWLDNIQSDVSTNCQACGNLYSGFIFDSCPYCFDPSLSGGGTYDPHAKQQSNREPDTQQYVSIREETPSSGRW